MKNIFQKKPLILSIIFFLFSCFIFIFLYRTINNNKEVSQLAQEKWQTEASQRNDTISLISSVKAIATERAQLETHFVQSSDVVPLLDTIEKLAQEVGTSAEVTSVNVAGDTASLIVEMKASGSFETICKLVMLLENSPYILEFVSVDIQNTNTQNISVGKNSKTPQWTAYFKIKLLSFVNQ